MRRTLLAAAVLVFPLAAQAAGPPQHASLSKKEIADGWILLFDGRTTFGWTSPDDSKWSVVGGMLAPQGDRPALLVSTTAFADYTLTLECRARGEQSLKVFTNADARG